MNKKITFIILGLFLAQNALAVVPSVSNVFSPSYTSNAWTKENISATVSCVASGTSTCRVFTCYDALNTCDPQDRSATSFTENFTNEGTHYLRYKGSNELNEETTVNSATIKIDKTAPAGSITSPGGGNTVQGSITIETSVSDSGSSISGVKSVKLYKLGEANYLNQASVFPYSFTLNTAAYSDTTHSFYLVIEDNAGNLTTSSQITWAFSNPTPLTLTKISGPGSAINSFTSAYSFSASKAGTFTVVGGCVFNTSTFAIGTNNYTITFPSIGTYSCTVSATATDGTTASFVVGPVTIDTTPPTASGFSTTPAASTGLTTASFTVTANETIAGVRYQRNNGSWLETTGSSFSLSSLPLGSHTINAQVKDVAGNWSSNSVTFSWTVIQSTVPECELTDLPSDPSSNTSINVLVGGSGVTHYKFRLNSGSWSSETPIATRLTASGLNTNKVHVLEVLCKNSAGIWQTTATKYDWEIKSGATDDDDENDTTSRYQFLSDKENGDSGKDVTILQRILKKEGFYKYTVNGLFDDKTEDALTAYQEEYGLTESGMLDSKTRAYLNKNAPLVDVSNNLKDETQDTSVKGSNVKYVKGYRFVDTIWKNKKGKDVEQLQKRLAYEKFYTGKITGIMDTATQAAMRKYQEAKKLDVMGILDDMTLKYMNANIPMIAVYAPQYTFTIARKLNDKGADIKKLQEILAFEGFYKYKPNGTFTANTKSALIKLQAKLKLTQTGALDLATIAKLNVYYKPTVSTTIKTTTTSTGTKTTTTTSTGFKFTKTLKLNDSGTDVTKLQEILKTMGFFAYTPTGKFTTGTRDALKKYQAKYKLETTGEVDEDTLDTLNSVSVKLLK